MKHSTLLALSGITLCSFTGVILWMVPKDEPLPYQRESEGPATMEEVTAIADALGLHWVAWPLNSSEKTKARLSVRPLSLEQCQGLWLHHPDFDRWRAVVMIMWGGRSSFAANFDQAHPNRYAIWGKWFVYGDPELIAKLLSCSAPKVSPLQ